jgi:hypothetical protein
MRTGEKSAKSGEEKDRRGEKGSDDVLQSNVLHRAMLDMHVYST